MFLSSDGFPLSIIFSQVLLNNLHKLYNMK